MQLVGRKNRERNKNWYFRALIRANGEVTALREKGRAGQRPVTLDMRQGPARPETRDVTAKSRALTVLRLGVASRPSSAESFAPWIPASHHHRENCQLLALPPGLSLLGSHTLRPDSTLALNTV